MQCGTLIMHSLNNCINCHVCTLFKSFMPSKSRAIHLEVSGLSLIFALWRHFQNCLIAAEPTEGGFSDLPFELFFRGSENPRSVKFRVLQSALRINLDASNEKPDDKHIYI